MCCLSWLGMVRAPTPTPPPAPPPASAPPLPGQPSEGGECRHPATPGSHRGARFGEQGYLLASICLFLLKGGSGATHLARVWNAILLALRECRTRRQSSPGLWRFFWNESPGPFPVRFAWSSEPRKPRKGLQGLGKSLCLCGEGDD